MWFSFLGRTNVEISSQRSQRKRHQRVVMKTQTPNTQISDLGTWNFRPFEFFFKKNIYIENLSQFLSPNGLRWCNVRRQQPERSEIFIFSGLSLLYRSNSENLTRFKIAADTMTFAGEFFTAELERQSSYNVVQIEVSFVSTRRDSDKPEKTYS